MIYGINYATKNYAKSQRMNKKTALKNGVDKFYCFGPKDIDSTFYEKNKSILDEPRGCGLWLWKSYFMKRVLDEMSDGDYLIYCDSGAIYVNDVHHFIDCMERDNINIMLFSLENGRLEKYFSKRDAFILLDCDKPEYYDTPQAIGGYVVLKKSKEASDFVEECLKYGQDRRIITNDENVMGLPNYEGFIENRHDQTIVSLLSKKHGIKLYRDPSQFSEGQEYPEDVINRSTYPVIINSHRAKRISFYWQVKFIQTEFYKKLRHKIWLTFRI